MLSLWNRGHLASCQAPRKPCTCEWKLYLITGMLAVLVGGIEYLIGRHASASLLSDAPHAWIDGSADFSAALLLIPFLSPLRRWSGKLFAILLGVALFFIAEDLFQRAVLGHSVASIPAFAAASASSIIDYGRWRILERANETLHSDIRQGPVAHAKGDFFHSVWASGIAAAAIALQKFTEMEGFIVAVDLLGGIALMLYVAWLTFGLWKGKEHSHRSSHSHHHH